jgi:uncharacterized protein YhfF
MTTDRIDPSVIAIGKAYFASKNQPYIPLPHWHFCDNEDDANACAELVARGIKRATSPSLWWHLANDEPLPQVGDLHIVTNWQGKAVGIIKTTAVELVAFSDISVDYARLEGEGDKSLDYWKRVHWEYYHRELAGTEYTPCPTMPIVCEQFTLVFSA